MSAVRAFGMHDQRWFAARSGDWNPLHVDPLAARRLLFGGPVVHGIHLTAWAVNSILAELGCVGRIGRLRVKFESPLLVGATAVVQTLAAVPEEIQLRVVSGRPLASITLNIDKERAAGDGANLSSNAPCASVPLEKGMDEMCDASGSLPAFHLAPDVAPAFPHLHEMLGEAGTSVLLASSRLVGMECPGLHSIFGSLDVAFSNESGDAVLRYSVERADPRISMLTIGFGGYGARGQIRVFMRPAPARQPSTQELSQLTASDEFAYHKVLVIGGSRGLGEVTAKLVATGGGEVILTYYRGAEEASRIVADIERAGGNASAIQLDVTESADAVQKALAPLDSLTGVFFFAAPKISLGKPGSFNSELFSQFCDLFVAMPCALAAEISSRCRPGALLFYPSTVFLDRPGEGGAEYCAAKAAGEAAWREFGKAYPKHRFVAERLPRLRTDQTASLQGAPAPEAAPALLNVLRKHLTAASAT